jgi:hypothetical protein
MFRVEQREKERVCVCERERERERESVCVRERERKKKEYKSFHPVSHIIKVLFGGAALLQHGQSHRLTN